VSDSALIDIVSEGFDAGIRYEETLAQGMVAISLAPSSAMHWWRRPRFSRVASGPGSRATWWVSRASSRAFAAASKLPWEFMKGTRTVKLTADGSLRASLRS